MVIIWVNRLKFLITIEEISLSQPSETNSLVGMLTHNPILLSRTLHPDRPWNNGLVLDCCYGFGWTSWLNKWLEVLC